MMMMMMMMMIIIKIIIIKINKIIIKNKKKPVTCIIGGSKVSTKINVLLMLSEGRHWNQERRDGLYLNGGRREHACSILFNWDGYNEGHDIVFHNDHVFMASDNHGFPDGTWEGNSSNRDGVNTIREKLKYPQHIWKGFRGITKHKIGDECTLDKSWAYDGQ